jgi:hypothetical protein
LGQDLGGYCRFDLEYYWGISGAVLMSFGQGKNKAELELELGLL